MDIRKEIKQDMYDLMVNESLSEDVQKAFDKASDLLNEFVPADKEDDAMNCLCNLEYAAFMAGVDMTLEFILGKAGAAV